MKALGIKKQNQIVDLLTEAMEAATMEKANFNDLYESEENPLPKSEKEVTDFIKKRTKLYRGSWIISPLEQILEIIAKN